MVNCAGQLIGIPRPGATVPSPSGQVRQRRHRAGLALPADLAEIILTGTVTPAGTSARWRCRLRRRLHIGSRKGDYHAAVSCPLSSWRAAPGYWCDATGRRA
jgi:hypothetical protein